MEITTLGIDLAKSVFQLHGVDGDGAVVLRKKLRRGSSARLSRDFGTSHDWYGSLCKRALLGP